MLKLTPNGIGHAHKKPQRLTMMLTRWDFATEDGTLPSGVLRLLSTLVLFVDQEGCLNLNAIIKQRIKDKVFIETQTLRSYLNILKDAGLLVPLCREYYLFNPDYFVLVAQPSAQA